MPVYNLSPWDVVVGESAAQGHPLLPRVSQVHPFSMPLSPKREQPINYQPSTQPTNQPKKLLPSLLWLFFLLSWLYFQMCVCYHPSKLAFSTILIMYENEIQSSVVLEILEILCLTMVIIYTYVTWYENQLSESWANDWFGLFRIFAY